MDIGYPLREMQIVARQGKHDHASLQREEIGAEPRKINTGSFAFRNARLPAAAAHDA